jgi:HK97 family phage portal protein
MGFLDKLLSRFGYEAKSVDISPELWSAINGGWGLPTKSGNQVSTTTALQQTAYYRGVVAIAEGIAQLPVEIRKERPGGRGSEPAKDHPLYDILLYQANNVQDAFQFFRTTLMHAVGAGNGVSYKNVLNGQVRELIPVRPECVSIDIHPVLYSRYYDLTFEKGQFVTVGQDQVFHIAGPSWGHYKGLDPAVVGREALGLSQVIEASHARLHANAARPSGVLQSEQKLDQTLVDRLRAQWREIYQGSDKTGEVAVLSGGLKWAQLSMTGVDAEHLDTRKHQIEEIARLLGIFPIMLGHAGDQSPTFASASAFLEAHVRFTLQPWIKAIILAIQTQLLTADERKEGYFIFIDTAELLRGSLAERTAYYKAALGTSSSPGWLNPNEVREDDGWNPDEDPKSDEIIRPFERQAQQQQGGEPGNL